MDAETQMRELGFKVSGSKISLVLNGHQEKADGFTWQKSNLVLKEIHMQDPASFIEYSPPRNSNQPLKVRLTQTG